MLEPCIARCCGLAFFALRLPDHSAQARDAVLFVIPSCIPLVVVLQMAITEIKFAESSDIILAIG